MRQAYICGKYSGKTDTEILNNIRSAVDAGKDVLESYGWFPIIPHVSMNHAPTVTDWNKAMMRCLATIMSLNPAYDCLVLLHNWRQSKGALLEVALAESLGIPTIEYAEMHK